MKTTRRLLIGLALGHSLLAFTFNASAQTARGLTRRLPNQPSSVTPQNQNPNQRQQPAPAPVVQRPAPVPAYATRPPESEQDKAARAQADQKAVEFEKKRAEEDFGWAQYALGVRYLTGNGVEKDPVQGRKWLQKAAKNGEKKAVKKLAELAEAGELDPSTSSEEKRETLPKTDKPAEPALPPKSEPAKAAAKK